MVLYRIDRNNRICFVNAEWNRFARDNGSDELVAEKVLNRPLLPFIQDDDTRHLHEVLLERVRSQRTPLDLPFRCDAPTVRRSMTMTIVPVENDAIEYRCRVLKSEERPAVPLVSTREDVNATLRMCSWCKRVEYAHEWLEVEDAVRSMGLLLADTPMITHTMCDPCLDSLLSD